MDVNTKYENIEEIEKIGGVLPFNISCEGDLCYLKFSELYKK
jgi:hypothetical protein